MTGSNASPPAAIVVGLDSFTGLQTARVLAGRGIPVVGIAGNRSHAACRTRACERIVCAGTSGDPLVEALLELGASLPTPAVLFPCTDLSVLTLSRRRDELRAMYRAVLPAPGVIEVLLDKCRFVEYAKSAGLPVGASDVVRTADDAARVAEAIPYPCVLKPGVKTAEWSRHTTAKLFKASNRAEFLAWYERCRDWTEALVAQEWIDGPDTAHFTCNAYFDARSAPVATFVSQKLRQWPLEGGIGCFSRECRDDTVLRETIRVFQGVGHHGLAYLEMKLDAATGRYVIIEPNVGRPTGRSACADLEGVDLLHTQYCDALGWELPLPREQRYRGAKWIHFRQDCQAAFVQWRRGTLRPVEWIGSLRGCRRDAVFSWRDPAPFVADLVHPLVRAIARRRQSAAPVLRPGTLQESPRAR